jgi:anti-sigma factor RsiW
MSNENPARKKFEPMLSPFVDGELTPEERQQVEQHLAANKESAMQVADFRAASGLMRLTFEQQADQEDWKDFSNQVLSKLTPEKPPVFERLKTSLSELFTYQRGTFVGAMATAALMVAVGATAFLMGSGSHAGYANERLSVQTVKVDQGAKVAPVVMETDNGDAIIWMVDSPAADKKDKKKDEAKKKPEGEETEETDPDVTGPAKKAGDL